MTLKIYIRGRPNITYFSLQFKISEKESNCNSAFDSELENIENDEAEKRYLVKYDAKCEYENFKRYFNEHIKRNVYDDEIYMRNFIIFNEQYDNNKIKCYYTEHIEPHLEYSYYDECCNDDYDIDNKIQNDKDDATQLFCDVITKGMRLYGMFWNDDRIIIEKNYDSDMSPWKMIIFDNDALLNEIKPTTDFAVDFDTSAKIFWRKDNTYPLPTFYPIKKETIIKWKENIFDSFYLKEQAVLIWLIENIKDDANEWFMDRRFG